MPLDRFVGFRDAKRKLVIRTLTITLVIVLLSWMATRGVNILPIACSSAGTHETGTDGTRTQRTYTTRFPLTENPISEGGNWVNGGTTGLDWKDVRSTPGLAFGTQTGATPPPYPDSTALLAGSWGNDQFVQVVVWWNGALGTNSDHDEVELRLRSSLAPHWATGYLINCRVGTPSSSSYIQMGRMNGAFGDFLWPPLAALGGTGAACQNGDVITGTVVTTTTGTGCSPGSPCAIVTAYINGKQAIQGKDTGSGVISSGAPGFGFWHDGSGQNSDFGISSFTASDTLPHFAGQGYLAGH